MKIVYLSNSELPSRTANSVHVMKMCQAMAADENDVTLFGLEKKFNGDIFKYYGVKENFKIRKQDRISVRGIGSVIYANRIKKNIKKINNIDILYGRDMYSIYVNKNVGINFIYESHAIPTTVIHRFIEKSLFQSKFFIKLVVISEALKLEYLKKYPRLNNKIIVAPDGADIPSMNDKKIIIKDTKIEIGVGYVGHLYSGRGIETIIKLAENFTRVKFHIVGGTDKDIDTWKEKCSHMSNVIFYGFVPNGELINYYDKFDIVLAPYQNKVRVAGDKGDTSRWMSPMKIFEYMSYKKAIIASDLPVLREIMIDGEDCMLCPPNDIVAWKNSLRQLLNDDKLRVKLSQSAYSSLEEKYTWIKRAQNILS